MYVCICGSVTEKQVKQAVKDGCTCLSQVQEVLPVAFCCQLCRCQVEEIIADESAITHSV